MHPPSIEICMYAFIFFWQVSLETSISLFSLLTAASGSLTNLSSLLSLLEVLLAYAGGMGHDLGSQL